MQHNKMPKPGLRGFFPFTSKSTTDLSEWNKNDDKLLKAVEAGDVKKVNSILTKKTLVLTKLGPRGHNVFHIACAMGNEQVVERLLKYSNDVSHPTIQGTTALQLAAAKGHTSVVHQLLQANAEVDMQDSNNMTALHHACAGLHLECVQVLLSGNASPHTKETTGKTPLFYAAHRGDVAICKWLVDKGADVNASDMYQMTSLIVASKEGHKEVVEFLLKKGAIPDHQDKEGRSALNYALIAGHHFMKEVFAKAPTRASWDVDPSNKSSAIVVEDRNSIQSEPEPEMTNQVDVVNTFSNNSPTLNHKDIAENKENQETDLISAEPNHTDSKKKCVTSENAEHFLNYKKTKQALKDLEEEHEQLNEELHNMSLEKMKLQDRVEFLTKKMEHRTEDQEREEQIQQDLNEEIKNLRNLLEEEQERSRDLSLRLLHSSNKDAQVILACSRKKNDIIQDTNNQDVQSEPVTRDSWGDSDDEFDIFDKKQTSQTSTDDAQIALLRSQILAVHQENDQLKEKLKFEKDFFSSDIEKLQQLQEQITRLEEEKDDLKVHILKTKENSETEKLSVAVDHEELVQENRNLKEELEMMKTRLSLDSESREQLLEQNKKLAEQLEEMKNRKEAVNHVENYSGEDGGSQEKSEGQKQMDLELLQIQNEQLTSQCSQLSEELEKLRTNFNAILKAGDNLQTDFDLLQNEKEKLQEEFERMIQEKEELVKENEFLLSDGNALHEDLKKLVHELEKMHEKLKKVQKEKDDSVRISTAVSLSGKVGEFTKLLEERDQFKNQLEELTEEWTHMQHDQEILVEEVQSLQEQVTLLSTERDKLQTNADDVETLLQQHEVLTQDYIQLEQDYAELLKEKEKLEQDLLDGQTKIFDKDVRGVDDLARENKTLGYEKEQLEMTITELSKANALLEEELGHRQQEQNHIQSCLDHKKDGAIDVPLQSAMLVEKEQQVQNLQQQVSILQIQLAEFDKQHREIVNTYRTHLISAVQGHMDTTLKKKLHQIIVLRSMEQFC